jgi:hypothetical protein
MGDGSDWRKIHVRVGKLLSLPGTDHDGDFDEYTILSVNVDMAEQEVGMVHV